jgi:hypothetical protein
MNRQFVVFLHGLYKRTPQYADVLINNVKGNLNDICLDDIEFLPIYYGDILQEAETIVKNKLTNTPVWNKEHLKDFRFSINDFLMDAIQWYDQEIRRRIVERVFESLEPKGIKVYDSVHLVLHSWGAVVALSDLSSLSSFLLPASSITTMGCALHLADLGRERYPKVDQTRWTNFYHTMDLIGVPLNSVYGCTDVEIKDAGPLTEIVGPEGIVLSGLAHNCYWESATIAKSVANRIKEHVQIQT